MPEAYHAGARQLQDRFDTRRLADRLDEKFLGEPLIGDADRAFIERIVMLFIITAGARVIGDAYPPSIERMDMCSLATADAAGRPQCSYKGGEPGFARVLDGLT